MLAWFALCACLLGIGAASRPAIAACPNDGLRTGASAELPDCRAYELVSPHETDGRPLGEIRQLTPFDVFPTESFSSFKDSVVYGTINAPLASPGEGNGSSDGYQAVRLSEGWETIRRITPSGAQAVHPNPGGVSADHQYAFVFVPVIAAENAYPGSLAAEGSADYLSKPDGSFELTGIGSKGVERLAQGMYISPGGNHVIFQTGGAWCNSEGPRCLTRQLEPNAPPSGTGAVYDRSADGPTQVISLLPDGYPPAAGEAAEFAGASPDGSIVVFDIGGTLYARIDNAVTEKVADVPATYAGVSADDRTVFYVSGGNIYAFDVASKAKEAISVSGDAEVVNVSADGSHVYFVSPSLLDGSNGTEGLPNLYVWLASSGIVHYITTVLPSDLSQTSGEGSGGYPGLANWTDWAVSAEREGPFSEDGRGPGADSSRTTPDGSVLVFESRGKLTDYENAGHTEIYRYDSNTGSLLCVSCNFARPAAEADARLQELRTARVGMVIHNVTDDGRRVFFETSEPLTGRDTDGINDIYEWSLEAVGSPATVDLISSGRSIEYQPPPSPESLTPLPMPNVLLGVSSGGGDVLFLSEDTLVPGAGEGGATALYDARVNGGFPTPAAPGECRDRETCQGSGSSTLGFPVPRSDSSFGVGNVKRLRHHRCRHRKRKSSKKHGCPRRHHHRVKGH